MIKKDILIPSYIRNAKHEFIGNSLVFYPTDEYYESKLNFTPDWFHDSKDVQANKMKIQQAIVDLIELKSQFSELSKIIKWDVPPSIAWRKRIGSLTMDPDADYTKMIYEEQTQEGIYYYVPDERLIHLLDQ